MSEIKMLLLKDRLRIDEAAIVLEVTPRTVRKYIEEGKLEVKLTPGGRRKVVTESVKRYL